MNSGPASDFSVARLHYPYPGNETAIRAVLALFRGIPALHIAQRTGIALEDVYAVLVSMEARGEARIALLSKQDTRTDGGRRWELM